MNNEYIYSGSQKTFGGVMLLASILAISAPAEAAPIYKAQVVAVTPVSVQMGKPFASGVVVRALSDSIDPRQELAETYELISKAQKPLEEEFSKFLAANLWDLL